MFCVLSGGLKSPERKLEAVLLKIIKGNNEIIPSLQLMSQMMGVHKIRTDINS